MRVDIQPEKGKDSFYRITPHGSIDSDSYAEFGQKVRGGVPEGIRNVLVDLAHVDYISSAGLGVLFTLKKTLSARAGELYFCNLKPQIRKLFEIVKALPKETLFENQEEADRYFYKIMNDEIRRQKGPSGTAEG